MHLVDDLVPWEGAFLRELNCADDELENSREEGEDEEIVEDEE